MVYLNLIFKNQILGNLDNYWMKLIKLNGLVYVFRPNKFNKSKCGFLFGKIGAEIVENENIMDIDTKKDFVIANALMKEKS